MSKALSVDLRTGVLAAVAAGVNHREAAAWFGVSAASVSRWRRWSGRRAMSGRGRSVVIAGPGGSRRRHR
jgi:transposase